MRNVSVVLSVTSSRQMVLAVIQVLYFCFLQRLLVDFNFQRSQHIYCSIIVNAGKHAATRKPGITPISWTSLLGVWK